jgi:hypothetical protein
MDLRRNLCEQEAAMGEGITVKTICSSHRIFLFLAAVMLACGTPRQPSQAQSSQESPAVNDIDTVRYLQNAYSEWAIRPIYHFEMRYYPKPYFPPYLDIAWNWADDPCISCDTQIRAESIRIDLRYVDEFHVFWPGSYIALDCIRGSGCVQSFGYTSSRGMEHFSINYKVRYANRIVNAFNHLVSIHASERPKGAPDPFAYCDPATAKCR